MKRFILCFFGFLIFFNTKILAMPNVRAPELQGDSWLNVSRPLSLAELKGSIVLLDFWTFCCINCMHVIPELHKLEHEFGNKLVVIGVHSAKFTNEKDTSQIRNAVLRYEVTHPVVNDASFKIWNSFGVRAWPTLVLIDQDGYVDRGFSGEGNYETIRTRINQLIKEKGIKEATIPVSLERNKEPPHILSFPGKIIADSKSKKLFISDSGNNRIIVTDTAGTILQKIGNGEQGNKDGDFSEAQFNHPQGLTLVGNNLYVADTENHLIRKVSLQNQRVTTVGGTGKQTFDHIGGNSGTAQPLNSPWDIIPWGESLLIAMAGNHQIWQYDPVSQKISAFLGSARETLIDGVGIQSAFAQPSGLAVHANTLFVADSETSSIRSIDLVSKKVSTLVGEGLFDFGDRDGDFESAILQHPLAVAVDEGKGLYVADSYNHKIKYFDLLKNTSATLVSGLHEPAGLTVMDGKLYIADTNAHQIVVFDLKVRTKTVLNLKEKIDPALRFRPNVSKETKPVTMVNTEVPSALTFQVSLPPNYHFTEGAPSDLEVVANNKVIAEQQLSDLKTSLKPFSIPKDAQWITVSSTIYFCKNKDTKICEIKSFEITVPIKHSQTGTSAIAIEVTAQAAS